MMMLSDRRTRGRIGGLCLAALLAVSVGTSSAAGQQPPDSREAQITRAKDEKVQELRPYEPNRAEALLERAEDLLLTGGLHWHPFFQSAYAGGGFTLGAGYMRHVSPYNLLDLRGSITFSGYKRLEAEFRAPRLFNRRGMLSVIGGWREATSVGFYGVGTGNTSADDRANYSFEQPYVSATLEVRPTRKVFMLGGALEYSQWKQGSGSGTAPSVEEVYTPASLPGLGASPIYLHSQGTVALDWRTSPGYSRRGGFYGVTVHDFAERDDIYSFRQVDYEVIQHIPILRDAWVLSLHGRVETTYTDENEQIPFFMLPALGGGSSLRGFASWRFRDRHSMLLQAEWRVLANRFLDVALFYDTGKVTARRADLDLDGLKDDYGLGFRFHGPAATPLRVELAKSNEGLVIVFSSKASF
jgi:Omp85 superfamily domain